LPERRCNCSSSHAASSLSFCLARLWRTARRHSADWPAIVRSISNSAPIRASASPGRALVHVEELAPHVRPAGDLDDVGGPALSALVEFREAGVAILRAGRPRKVLKCSRQRSPLRSGVQQQSTAGGALPACGARRANRSTTGPSWSCPSRALTQAPACHQRG